MNNDRRLIPLLKMAKKNFELALEDDNSNRHTRYWSFKLHLKYHVPGACKAIGAALLVEAANMLDPDAQYELGCHLRVENDYVQLNKLSNFYYIEKAIDQLHPGAPYLLGAVYLTGDCVRKDTASALWCFHGATEKVYKVLESLTKFNAKRGAPAKRARLNAESVLKDSVEIVKEQFEVAARAGCDL